MFSRQSLLGPGIALAALAALLAASAPARGGEEGANGGVVILDTTGFWRCHFTLRDPVYGTQKEAKLRQDLPAPLGQKPKYGHKRHTDPPSADWMKTDFDDTGWARRPGPFFGGYGFKQQRDLGLLCLRGTFNVPEGGAAGDLTLSLVFRGGMRVWLNGEELARAHLPEGEITPDTLAEDYPFETYSTPDGTKTIRWGWGDPKKYNDRCEMRIRRIKALKIPAAKLRKGLNVLGIEVHRAATPVDWLKIKGYYVGSWNTVGLNSARLTSARPGAVTPNLARPKGFQVWNADVLTPVFDLDYGDPNTPLRPIRIVAARNGVFSGQVVASREAPIKKLAAEMGDLTLKDGDAAIPPSSVEVRYPTPGGRAGGAGIRYPGISGVSMFDVLAEEAPAEVPVFTKSISRRYKGTVPVFGTVQPIWVTVRVPEDQAAGEYEGVLTIKAEGVEPVAVPVRLKVCEWTLPKPIDYTTHVDFIESPESVAMRYELPLWSEKHWERVGRSLDRLARFGNKTIYIPVICRTNFGNAESMVRWIKEGEGYKYDFTPMEKYLDLYLERVGKPQFVIFYVSDRHTGSGYFGRKAKNHNPIPVSLLDPETGKITEMAGPSYDKPEVIEFFRPVAEGLRERLKARGLEGTFHIGNASDSKPSQATVMCWKEVAPEAKWTQQGHGLDGHYYKVRVGYNTTVWKPEWPWDPEVRRTYGWQRKDPYVAHFHRDIWKLDANRQLLESRLTGERNIAGRQNGFGRMSADFWRVLKDKDGKLARAIQSRYPETSWAQCNCRMTPYLAPGPEGALGSVRFEMLCEGVQECEARIFIEKALLADKGHRKIIVVGEPPAETAARLQALLDKRTRSIIASGGNLGAQWCAASAWQDRSEQLFAAAAEVTKALSEEAEE